MRKKNSPRRLVVDEATTYLWTLRHRHRDGDVCREVLTLHRDGVRVRLVFRAGPGRVVAGFYHPSGHLTDEHHPTLNLNEPGVVRAFVDEAQRRGLLTENSESDGWELFAAVSRARAATPAAPPDCPPGP